MATTKLCDFCGETTTDFYFKVKIEKKNNSIYYSSEELDICPDCKKTVIDDNKPKKKKKGW